VISGPGLDLCVTIDTVVEGIHFLRPQFRFEDIGHKALAVNLSDLAAMGATPRWFLCALAVPTKIESGAVARLARGMSALARRHRIRLLGGNVSAASELSITITAAGEVSSGRALTRSGGSPGDLLYVSGTLGDARLGLSVLKQGGRTGAAARQLRPSPKVGLGQLAVGYAHAAIDLSDGFAQDLEHLCRASAVGARVEAGRLPISRELRRRVPSLERATHWALAGGEDYQLLLAVPPQKAASFERRCARAGERVSQVGALTTGAQLQFISPSGKQLPPPGGFDHFVPADPPPRI
jgi:thiamine-monophosphate kinase